MTDGTKRDWRELLGTFWGIFMCLNLLAVLLPFGTLVWVAFNIHERLPCVMLAQIPALVMMGIRRFFRD